MPCAICLLHPGAHSFVQLEHHVDHIPVYYTCPAQASEYWDGAGIVSHMRNVLADHGFPPQWIWKFDAQGFTLRHALEFGVAMDLLALFRTEDVGQRLHSVIIINGNGYLRAMLTLLQPLMSSALWDKIHFE